MRRVGELRVAAIGIAVFALGDGLWLIPSLPLPLPSISDAP